MRTIYVVIGSQEVPCKYVSQGFFLGDVPVCGTNFHVEAIRLTRKGDAMNADLQNRIDRFAEANDGLQPQPTMVDGQSYYVHFEPFAQ